MKSRSDPIDIFSDKNVQRNKPILIIQRDEVLKNTKQLKLRNLIITLFFPLDAFGNICTTGW